MLLWRIMDQQFSRANQFLLRRLEPSHHSALIHSGFGGVEFFGLCSHFAWSARNGFGIEIPGDRVMLLRDKFLRIDVGVGAAVEVRTQ